MESVCGSLLVAGPALLDPNFARSVVLIADHDEDGALGVILNRPLPVAVHDAAPPLAPLVDADASLFRGGPVQPQAVVVLAEFERVEDAGVLAFDSIGFLLGDVDPDVAGRLRRARVFAGYAGWGPGQLDAELEEDGGWIVEPALPADPFTGEPDQLWSAVLRRKGGHYAILAMMPLDPSLN
ncbi:MAG TPA: YqgE/AlgH family protein [Actinomycetota bacterium]